MALLHYWNLGVHRPDVLMRRAFGELKTFYEFLNRTRNYLESDAAVKRLAWYPGEAPANGDHGAGRKTGTDSRRHRPGEVPANSDHGARRDGETGDAVWVLIEEPRDRPNEPEATFRMFLDENVKELYEAEPSTERDEPEARRGDRLDFGAGRKIAVIDRDPEGYQLLLEREPALPELLLRPNTWPIACQIRALQTLQSAPSPAHLPLLRLFEGLDHATWPIVEPVSIEVSGWQVQSERDRLGRRYRAIPEASGGSWMVLSDANRPGTGEQRRFVERTLGTPDFAFLEGPPGSGKTTAICELVLQLAKRGKRVLLSASTHVAVDNVLERLMDEPNPHRDLVIPVRIGDRRNVSEKARPWQLEHFVRTERERLLGKLLDLERRRSLTRSQETLLEALRAGPSVVERLVLDAANLVCGTTIGILQHPDIKSEARSGGRTSPIFDMLIIDEASKTPFQEFLVPALLAKRWIIVGDPKQLSPYVDEHAMAVNVEACLPDARIRDACIDAFMAGHPNSRSRRTAAVVAEDEGTRRAYIGQCAARDVALADADRDDHELPTAGLVVGTSLALERRVEELPLDLATVRSPENALHVAHRRADAWLRLTGRAREERPQWAAEVGWRLASLYEQRIDEASGKPDGDRRTTAERLRRQVEELLPVAGTGAEPESIWQEIDRVRRVALPSVLESLRNGFERGPRQRNGSAVSDGLPPHVLEPRHVLLSTQHRMHPEIAQLSHVYVYDSTALQTPEYMATERKWSYSRYDHRTVWRDVRGRFDRRFNRNKDEARSVAGELRHFDEWARANPRDDGRPWEAAVLTFYRGQEREVRLHLREWTRQDRATRHFARGPKHRPYLLIELCTVDRFQGHEADLVLISFARPHPTSFLESPNRLNVALTRARYQRVVIGHRQAMRRARGALLKALAEKEPWEQDIDERRQR
ncbi:MAG: AAA domain-containing protein [Chromatiales bacterium]|nr:AAA domain-containing protein [Chromatiales bacterium]